VAYPKKHCKRVTFLGTRVLQTTRQKNTSGDHMSKWTLVE